MAGLTRKGGVYFSPSISTGGPSGSGSGSGRPTLHALGCKSSYELRRFIEQAEQETAGKTRLRESI